MILKFFNMLFRIFLIFILCLIWVRYFIKDFTLALLYTSILSISIELIIHFISSKKNFRNTLKKNEEILSEKISSTFIFEPQNALIYFYNLCKINYSAKKQGAFIVIQNKNLKPSTPHLSSTINNQNDSKTILHPLYSYSPISAQQLVEIIKRVEKVHPTKLIICGYKIDDEAYKLANKIKGFKIILLNSKDCFTKLIKPYNFYPNNLREISLTTKPKLKEILALAFNKQRAKGYLIAVFFLLFSSFIVKMNIYYTIMASILLIFTLLSLFLPHKNSSFEKEIL